MDGVGNEVSHKIRAAIKAKLIELGAYVDDELPDYIMVMVANKRSRLQMEEDLSLFLNNNTKVFTSWLHTVLQKLQEVTVAASDKREESKKHAKKKRSLSSDSAAKASNSSVDKEKTKSKHKEKKQKKSKHKNKESKSKKSRDVSDWKDNDFPKKKIKKEKPDSLDVTKEVGRAIIGSLKEKHKGDDIVLSVAPSPIEAPPSEPSESIQVEPPKPIPECDILDIEASVPVTTPVEEKECKDGEEISIIEVKVNSNREAVQAEPTIMAPTRELLKEHDKLTLETTGGNNVEKRPSQASSEGSVSPEELRKQLLLSRAKRKLEERNLERRMRSNSPEVIILDDKPAESEPLKPVKPAPIEAKIPVRKSSESRSPRISLSPNSSLDSSRRRSSASGRVANKRKKVVVLSRIVAPPDPEEPGISSVVHVKPREFAPIEKQANKNLILKAVAAAERSVAHASSRKMKELSPQPGQRPVALFTRDLRGKRFENFAVTLPNDIERRQTKKETRLVELEPNSDVKNSVRNRGEEENFISSKTTAKDRNESFIKCWLEDVEKAGKNDALIKPDEIDKTASADEEETGDGSQGSDGAEGRIEALQDGPQIVVTVDGLRSNREGSIRIARDRKIKSLVDVNRISNRFARISKPSEEHEFKEKYLEFERVRSEKKISQEGESKNKRLIAELSMKFGRVDRVFENEEKSAKKRTDDRREEDIGRKRETGRSGDESTKEKREKKSIKVSGAYDDVRMKSNERCRFWPDCARGSSCEFHHPSSVCKLLPNCKFKDKCMGIHPICKNDRDCSLKDCSYEHSSSRRKKPDSSRDSHRGLCKYDLHCKNKDCTYQHSKQICRYGSRCKSRDCPYSHSHKGSGC